MFLKADLGSQSISRVIGMFSPEIVTVSRLLVGERRDSRPGPRMSRLHDPSRGLTLRRDRSLHLAFFGQRLSIRPHLEGRRRAGFPTLMRDPPLFNAVETDRLHLSCVKVLQ